MEAALAQLPQQLVNGLTLGAVYALIAIGYSMVYGVLKMLNFAHGDVYMIGAFIGYGVMITFLENTSANAVMILILMLLAAMVGCGILGVGIERVAYRRLRNAPRLAALISALGVSFFIQNATQLTLTARQRSYRTEQLIPPDMALNLAGARISLARGLVVITTGVLMVLLHRLVKHSKLGKAMRAVATDPEAASMMGVDVTRVIVATFFIGSVLAGAAGVMTGIVFIRVWHFMGFMAGLKGFIAAVVGGIGNIPGAVLGGLLLGLAETMTVAYISPIFNDTVAFLMLIAVLLLRPRGLLGARLPAKV